ncbi:MAG: T9SS type A sorting domain-containing protein, partial [Flavobacteriales bacterium]
ATESTDSSCENASDTNLDVWYEFNMPVSGNIKISNIPNTVNATLYDACGGSEIDCFNDDGFFYSLNAGTNYVLRISERDLFAGTVNFRIEAFTQAPNDECVNSKPIAVGVVSPINYEVDTRSATESIDASCDNANKVNHDMWYKFEMPLDGNIQITGIPNLAGVSLFDACGGTEISCFYNDGTFFNLSANTSYILRISEEAFWAHAFSFDIQAVPAALPPCTDTTEFIAGAWNNGVPDNTKNAVIRSNYLTSDVGLGSITACSCSIDLGTTLTIDSGDYLDVSFGITVDGTLNVNHQGSVLQRDAAATTTNNGNINVHMTTPFMKPKDFMITGSPMTAETRNGVYNSAFRMLHHITGNFVPHPDVETDYPDAENFADDNNDNWALHNGLINPAEGYAVKPQPNNTDGNTTYDFTFSQGTLNTGDITYNVLFNTTKNDSPNMLANPYPSAIFAGDFINQNSMVDEVFFWEHLTPPSTSFPGANSKNYDMEDISMYNLTGGVKAANDATGTTKPDGYIASTQGFGIKATAAGTALFTNTMRRTSHNTTLRENETEKNRIWLDISSEDYGMKTSTLIGFMEEASASIDKGYDSKRLATLLSIYSHLEDGSQELGIQAREAFYEDIQIPMGFSTQIEEVTEYTISVSEIEGNLLNQETVYLVDHQEHTITNLSEEDYHFMSNQGTFNNRFTLQFTEKSILGISKNELQSIFIYPNPANDYIIINNSKQLNLEQLIITDLTGRMVKNVSLKEMNTEQLIDISKLANATYLMTIKTENNELTKRIIKK